MKEKPEEKLLLYADAINSFVDVGHKLHAILLKQKPIDRKNIFVLVFARKTVRLLESMRILLGEEFTEEAQILARALLEVKFALDYVLKMKEKYNELLGRYIDSLMLDKLKQLRATNWAICPDRKVKNSYLKIERDIQSRYPEKMLQKLKRHGFIGLSVKDIAEVTDNIALYDMAYRLYSRNIHFTDGNEQLMQLLNSEEANIEYEKSRFKMILEVIFICGESILRGINEWIGEPIDLANNGLPHVSL